MMGPALDEREIQRRLDACSKHRKNMMQPSTPEGFWIPYFEETPVDSDRVDEQSIRYQFKSLNDIIQESQQY